MVTLSPGYWQPVLIFVAMPVVLDVSGNCMCIADGPIGDIHRVLNAVISSSSGVLDLLSYESILDLGHSRLMQSLN